MISSTTVKICRKYKANTKSIHIIAAFPECFFPYPEWYPNQQKQHRILSPGYPSTGMTLQQQPLSKIDVVTSEKTECTLYVNFFSDITYENIQTHTVIMPKVWC